MSFALDMGIRQTQTIAALFDVGSTCNLERGNFILNVDGLKGHILQSENKPGINLKMQ